MSINAALKGGLIFPITGYKKSIVNVPELSKEDILLFYKENNTTSRQLRRSYNFLIEGYVDKDSMVTNTDKENGIVYVKGRCYRSKKKNESPYLCCAALKISGNENPIIDGYCECAAGLSATCNHFIAFLRQLQCMKFEAAPTIPCENNDTVSCTSKKQEWGRPRGKSIRPLAVMDANFQSPKEGGSSKPLNCRIYEGRAAVRDKDSLNTAVSKLFSALQDSKDNDNDFSLLLPSPNCSELIRTKMGDAMKNSVLSYQLPIIEPGMEVIFNFSTFPITTPVIIDRLIRIPVFSTQNGREDWFVSGCYLPLPQAETEILLKNELSSPDAANLERNTVSQADCLEWKNARQSRLSSSNFGTVCKRRGELWSEAGITNVVVRRDIGHVNSIKYGKTMEPIAKQKYVSQMHSLGHNIVVHPSGFVVSPLKCWLGTSPDGLVYDPRENPPYGLLEIKSPYTLRDKSPSEFIEESKGHFFKSNGSILLSKTHDHFHQITGQMGLTALTWCDYVVFLPKGLIICRVRFDVHFWNEMVEKLDRFYFSHMLKKLTQATVLNA